MPAPLKKLLETRNIKKTGNRICSDIQKLHANGIELTAGDTVELGHLAYDRCICPTRAPSLALLVDELFDGVILEKGAARTSDWSRQLSQEQIDYAAKDVYATIMVYKKLMTIMDPKAEMRNSWDDVQAGMKVILYNRSWRSRAAHAEITSTIRNGLVMVTIREEDIITPSSIVGSEVGGTLGEKMKEAKDATPSSSVITVPWKLIYIRRVRTPVGADEGFTINSIVRQVDIDSLEDITFFDQPRTQRVGREDSGYDGDADDRNRSGAQVEAADAHYRGYWWSWR